MTQGISSLPGAQQAPGQAPMPQVLPAPQAKTPASEIAQYQAMPLPQLIAAFQQQPSGPLLGLITKKAEAEKRRKREEQQRAMGAYAQQGPQTVKDMALADAVGALQPQMARHGGVMHGYSGGGAVALQSGGDPEVERILKKAPMARTAEENAYLQARGVPLTQRTIPPGSAISRAEAAIGTPFIRELVTGGMHTLSDEELAKRQGISALNERLYRGLGGQQYTPAVPAVGARAERAAGTPSTPAVTPLASAVQTGVASLPGAELNTPQARAASAGAEDAMGEFARLASLVERAESGSLGQSAVSPAGAIGVMQVMPGTAPEAAKLAGVPFDEKRYRTDADYNRRIGQAYLMKQLEDFGGDTAKALAAYNAGPARVKKAIETAMRSRGDANWLDFVPDETKGYVQKIMTSYSGGVPGEFARKDMPPSAPQGTGGPGIAALPAAAAAAPVAGQGISPTMDPELEAAIKARATQLEASKNLPPEVLEARKGLAALEAANIEAQQAGVKGLREESEAALEAARKARGASRLDDIQYIGQMLEGMRGAKRLGEGLAGVASGAGRAEAGRAAALKEAEKLRREDQRLIRAEEAAGRQLQILAQQRVVAERQGEFDRVAKIDAEISQVKLGLAQAKQAQAEKAAEFGLKQTDTESRRITAEAAKAGVAARQGAAGARGNITPDDLLRLQMQAEQQVDTALKTDVEFAKLRTPQDKKTYRDQKVNERVNEALRRAGYPVAEAASPAPAGRVIDFTSIK